MVSTSFDDILGAESDIDLRSEKAIQNEALVALWAIPNSFWWRVNTGTAWQGRKVKHDKDVLVLADARPIKFGLEGIADIMGHYRGRAVAIEMKDAVGRQRRAQKAFEAAWTAGGGIYILARTVAAAVSAVERISIKS